MVCNIHISPDDTLSEITQFFDLSLTKLGATHNPYGGAKIDMISHKHKIRARVSHFCTSLDSRLL
jgi:hypothetical protein